MKAKDWFGLVVRVVGLFLVLFSLFYFFAAVASAISPELGRGGTPPQSLDVQSQVTFDRIDGNWTVASSELQVRGRVSGIDQAGFQAAAERAKDGCPVSRALAGNVKLSVQATLES